MRTHSELVDIKNKVKHRSKKMLGSTFNKVKTFCLSDNSITVFTSKEAGVNNPNSAKNTYVSKTEFLVNMNG